jgi:hypothetical protein
MRSSTEGLAAFFAALLQDPVAVRRAMHKAFPRGRGPPRQNDDALLREMARLVRSETREYRAAGIIAKRHPSQSLYATRMRLYRKFLERREELLLAAAAAELLNALRPAAELIPVMDALAVRALELARDIQPTADALAVRLRQLARDIDQALT